MADTANSVDALFLNPYWKFIRKFIFVKRIAYSGVNNFFKILGTVGKIDIGL